jgi:hypothetical protein
MVDSLEQVVNHFARSAQKNTAQQQHILLDA